jgi:hypothetical protein
MLQDGAGGDGGGAGGQAKTAEAAGGGVMARQARRLLDLVARLNPQEFYWQEAHYDNDSRQGRELLFLIANHEWVAATSELISVSRSDAVETTIKIDVDLGQITHEAFRNRSGRIWLPVTVLPPQAETAAHGQLGDNYLEPDPFTTVTDAAGNLLPMLPAADLRHQLSAAMAEIIVNLAVAHWPGPASAAPPATRDERLLLSAAIYRMLRPSTGHDQDVLLAEQRVSAGGRGARGARRRPLLGAAAGDFIDEPTPRIVKAKEQLIQLLDMYVRVLEADIGRQRGAGGAEVPQFAPELARRAIAVLRALGESVIVVVPINYDATPTVLTVRVPTRNLECEASWRLLRVSSWLLRPLGRLEVDVLMPTSDADRQIQVHLPDGVVFDQPGPRPDPDIDTFPHLGIRVPRPQPFQDLTASIEQVFDARTRAWPGELASCFVDLARVNAVLALETLRYYQVGQGQDGPPTVGDRAVTAEARNRLRDLVTALEQAEAQDDAGFDRLREAWRRAEDGIGWLYRRTSASQLSQRTVVARTEMIEDASQRAVPERAKIYVDVTIDDRDYFAEARSSTGLGLLLMVVVLSMLLGWRLVNSDVSPAPEVLAIVLTLFATIQAGRIERPDRSTLHGQLASAGTWLITASTFPALLLSLELAFSPGGYVAVGWAGGSVGLQLALLVLMSRGPLVPGDSLNLGQRRVFQTVSPDYRHLEALRSDYWRTTTADALMLGRKAHAYVLWHKAGPDAAAETTAPQLKPLLTWEPSAVVSDESTSVLALLHAGTLNQAVTFVVFRGKPDQEWAQDALVRAELDLDPSRLAPLESVSGMVDVFVGVDRDVLLPLGQHPVVGVTRAAARRLVVLETQLPVPPPIEDDGGLLWARVRVALRDRDDIGRLKTFLGTVYGDAVKDGSGHALAVQAVPLGFPRVITTPPRPAVAGPKYHLVLSSDLDVTNTAGCGNEEGGCTWRMLTMCADGRSNIDSVIMRRLARERPGFQLVGYTFGLLHGTALVVALVHEPAAPGSADSGADSGAGSRAGSGAGSRASLEADMRKDPALAKLRVLVDEELSHAELGPTREYPMIRVRYRWQDHPGAFLQVVESISATLCDELESFHSDDWSISYARIQVITGRMALGRVALRLHTSAREVTPWGPRKMEDIERRVASLASAAAMEGQPPVPGGLDLERFDDIVISMDLIRRLRANHGG